MVFACGSHLLLCYQVVGLPKPRQNHAVVMAKFAEEILRAMRVATSDLDSQLGPGTADLAIRIGVSLDKLITKYLHYTNLTVFCLCSIQLNSGPTTGKQHQKQQE
jgi:hypothetical protein